EAQKQREVELQQQNQASGSRGQCARAVYDYDATADDELGFREGEIVYNVEQLDPGCPAAPPMAPPLPQAPAQNDMGENYAVALFEYVAAEEGELSFEEGEYVTHIEFLSDDWWEGANKHGEFGLFPSNFVKLQK
ncbi:actin binding protein, partial [Coemansia sp. RSA 371]